MDTTLSLLKEAGYKAYYQVLNASGYGVHQKRERLYFVCFREEQEIIPFHFPEPANEDVVVEDILLPEGDPLLDDLFIERDDMTLREFKGLIRENKPIRIGTVGKGGQGERVYSPKGHAITISAFGGGVGARTGMYLIGDRIRRLHPRECARLMGFDDTRKPNIVIPVSDTSAYQQFGNTVIVPVIEVIANAMKPYILKLIKDQ